MITTTAKLVFVPYRGFCYLYYSTLIFLTFIVLCFRPLSGILLFIPVKTKLEAVEKVFVPYRGFCYLYNMINDKLNERLRFVVFVPYRGFCYLYNNISVHRGTLVRVFVPYRGFCYLYPTPL